MSEVSGEEYGAERCRVYVSEEDVVGLNLLTEAVYAAVRTGAGVDGGAIIPQSGRWYNDAEPGVVVEVVYPVRVEGSTWGPEVRRRIKGELAEVKARYGNTFFVTFERVVACEIF